MVKQKVYLIPKNLDQFKYGITGFTGSVFEWYLFQLIVLLNPDFNYCYSFGSSWVDKVTTGT